MVVSTTWELWMVERSLRNMHRGSWNRLYPGHHHGVARQADVEQEHKHAVTVIH